MAEFLRRSAEAHPSLLALRGRCYENEHVPYKAFDGCIDELAKFLRRLPDAECAALLPVRATLLSQLFPVLKNIRSIARSPRDGVAGDLSSRRLEAFEALAGLLARIAEDRPLALIVDDLQWADAESFRMLQALVERAQPPALVLIATVRPREELDADVLAHANALRSWKNTEVVPLFGLPREQARALAAKLMNGRAPDAWLDVIAEQSEGHPLFLSELVQFTQSHELNSRSSLTLDAALRSRIDRLGESARNLLEVVALAARPHLSQVFARALAIADIEEPVRLLLGAKLLRLRKGQELGCYHDRIRHTASDLVGTARRIAIHRRIAAAAETLIDECRASPLAQTRAQMQLYTGLVHLARGNRERALSELRAALATLTVLSRRFVYPARYAVGALEGGPEGNAKCQAVRDAIRAQGYKNLDRALDLYVAGLPLLG